MADQLTIVNSILRRLREETVATVSESGYSQLVAQFVNDAIADMEDTGHTWSAYITEVDDTITSDGTTTYDITETNDRSYLMRNVKNSRVPMAFDVTSNEKAQLFDIPYSNLLEIRAQDNNSGDTVERPGTFAIKSDADGRGFTLELVYGSSTERTWRTYWYVPQTELSVTSNADATTEILLPRRPIELRALYYALEERGEIAGPRGGSNAWQRSHDAIAAAIEIDQQINKDWERRIFTNNERL
jgi:hypothetical protein